MSNKVRENAARRKAKRLDLVLNKSRGRIWNFDNQLGYMICDLYGGYVIVGRRFELDLDDVEEYLNDYEKKLIASS